MCIPISHDWLPSTETVVAATIAADALVVTALPLMFSQVSNLVTHGSLKFGGVSNIVVGFRS
jgi:hypothetical protein